MTTLRYPLYPLQSAETHNGCSRSIPLYVVLYLFPLSVGQVNRLWVGWHPSRSPLAEHPHIPRSQGTRLGHEMEGGSLRCKRSRRSTQCGCAEVEKRARAVAVWLTLTRRDLWQEHRGPRSRSGAIGHPHGCRWWFGGEVVDDVESEQLVVATLSGSFDG